MKTLDFLLITMANRKLKFNTNISGKYFVDKNCIGCLLCKVIAPNNFVENLDENIEFGNNYVSKQPVNMQEEALCLEAMENCPADAIGNDGAKR